MGNKAKARPTLVSTTEYLFEGVVEVVKVAWPAGYHSPKRAHGKSCVYIHVLRGEVYVSKDGDLANFGEGETVAIPQGAIHAIGSVGGAETLECHIPPIASMTTVYND